MEMGHGKEKWQRGKAGRRKWTTCQRTIHKKTDDGEEEQVHLHLLHPSVSESFVCLFGRRGVGAGWG